VLELLSNSWWEPGSPGVFDVGDMAVVLGFALTIVGAATGLSRWWMRQLKKTIHDEVEDFTQPIQPTANGGLSLPDVARKVEKLEYSVDDLKEDNKKIEKSIDDLRKENRETWGLLIKHLTNLDKKS
jgi:pilus assembly protein TadC